MRIAKKAALFCCTFFAVLALLWPGMWAVGSGRKQISQWVRGSRLAYQGTLVLWYVPSDAAGAGDGSAWVETRMKRFEREHFGIFYTLEKMDAQTLSQRVAAGETPDMVFFGNGEMNQILLQLRRCTAQQANWMPAFAAQTEGGRLWPLFYGGYALLVNEQALYNIGQSPPLDVSDMQEEYISEIVSALPGAFGYQDEKAVAAAMGMAINDQTKAALATGQKAGLEDFLQEKVAFFACPASTWYALEKRGNTQSIPAYQAYPATKLAISVQWGGVMETEDENKALACEKAMAFLLSRYSQQRLEEIGSLPVIDDAEEPLQAQGTITGALWQNREVKSTLFWSLTKQPQTFLELAGEKGLKQALEWWRDACTQE